MACCFFGRRRRGRSDGSEHDVFLYPILSGAGTGEVLLQYGGPLRPELIYGGADVPGTVRTTAHAVRTARVTRRQLDEVAPEYVVGGGPVSLGRRGKRSRAKARHPPPPEPTGECTICLEGFAKGDKYRTLRCKHAFHSDCILTWLHGAETCPGKLMISCTRRSVLTFVFCLVCMGDVMPSDANAPTPTSNSARVAV